MPAGLVWMTAVAAGSRNICNESVLLEITHCEIQREYPFRPYRSWSAVVLECQKLKWFLSREC